jgi:elongation factor G
VVNGIDRADARSFEGILAEVRELFGKECLPVNLPAPGGTAVIDCFFQPAGPKTAFSSIAAAHREIVEQVVEIDEALMARYLEQGQELTLEQLHDPFERALREGHLVPVCFASATSGAGVPELVRVIEKLLPNPAEGNPPPFLKGEAERAVPIEVRPDPTRHLIAHVFKVTTDPFLGKVGFVRVHQGTLTAGAQVFVGDARKPVKVSRIFRPRGKDRVEIDVAVPGDIVAIPKIEELFFDAVLHDSHDEDHHHLNSVTLPPPIIGLTIEPERSADEQKLSTALHRIVAEDPCVRVEHVGRETVIYGLGELHLRVLLDRMKERAGVSFRTRPPSIPYRETVMQRAEGHHRRKKQTGGAGQFGEVFLRVEPLPRGAGFEFVDEVVGGAIPSQFIPAVEKGVRRALAEGAIAGYPIVDIRVVVHDGKSHAVDSKEVAFVAAGRKAMLDAVKRADPILLEPVVRMESFVPESAIGAVSGEISTRHGRVIDNQRLADGSALLAALVPLSEVRDYASRLKSLTGGEGEYTLALTHYDRVPPRRQQELVSAFRPSAEDDD